VGIIGYGKVGQLRHRVIDRHLLELDVVALCDPNLTGTGYGVEAIYPAWQQMLAHSNLDAVVVCVPNFIAHEITAHCLKAGLHVFCEKPPARSVEDLKIVEQALTSSRAVLMYGFNHRYHGAVQAVKEHLDSGGCGRILSLRGLYGKPGFECDEDAWRVDLVKSGGGILIDQGIHMVDLFRHLTGVEFTDIHAYKTIAPGMCVENNVWALLKSSCGIVAQLTSSAALLKHRFELEVSCEYATLAIDGILSNSMRYAPEYLNVAGPGVIVQRNFVQDMSWKQELIEWYRCIMDHDTPSHGTLLDAINTLGLVEQIYGAADDECS